MSYTSKYYPPGAPNSKVARFPTGKASPDYNYTINLVSKGRVQIRHNALEAARVAANKKLVTLGEEGYLLTVKTYPHEILRENKMIATAGADRLQEGMRKAFGKPIGVAALVHIGSVVLDIRVKAENLDKAKAALKAATTKLPFKYKIVVTPLEKKMEAEAVA